MVKEERVHYRNNEPVRDGDYVLYWMQQSQRSRYNEALEYAVTRANDLGLPCVVFFGVTPEFPEANRRHYRFMLEGLIETKKNLEARNISFLLEIADPVERAASLAGSAALLVIDRGYLKIQRWWRTALVSKVACMCVEVESDVVVPVETASIKEEYSAATLRRKIMPLVPSFLMLPEEQEALATLKEGKLSFKNFNDPDSILDKLNFINRISEVEWIHGGTGEAEKHLNGFVKNNLKFYDTLRNDPTRDFASHMSPYLHFGQISPVYIALKIIRSGFSSADKFIDELVVRRELSVNFLYYNTMYDRFEGLSAWAIKTLEEHAADPRPFLYTLKQFEKGATHDRYWNAAQMELVKTGAMQGYMRMYWGKKILEWTNNPQEAFDVMVALNNRYALDGRDANSYAGIAWCLGKHDRPWKERPIFGKVRYMNENGLKRKFDIDRYAERIESL